MFQYKALRQYGFPLVNVMFDVSISVKLEQTNPLLPMTTQTPYLVDASDSADGAAINCSEVI